MLPQDVPDLKALDILDSVAELGSLGQAAIHHRISQPAVSVRMAGLERRLGLSLFQRTPTGTHLTPEGQRIAVRARRALAEVQGLMWEAETLRAEQRSHLRVFASLTVTEHLLPKWIGTIHQQSPNVSLTLEVANSQAVLSAVIDGRADIGFVEGQGHDPAGLESDVVQGDQLVVVVDNAHPWARNRRAITGEQLAAAELIVREKGSGTREVLEEALRPWGGIRFRLELGSLSAILAATRRGEGPAVLSNLTAAEDLAAGRLTAVEVEGVDFTRAFRAVWRSDRPLPVLGRQFLAAAKS